MTITDLCEVLRNWFETKKLYGTFTITDGQLDLSDFLLDGQYYRIVDSVFNQGVHQYGEGNLHDETFTGEIWAMAIPQSLLELKDEIDTWIGKYGDAINSPYTSESFGGYSVSMTGAGNGDAASGGGGGWQTVFAGRLNRWRKI